MKRLLYLLILITPLTFLNFQLYSQCDINAGCAGTPILNVDPPVFDAATSSIILNNITVGEFECTEAIYQSGVVFYIYQLLPDGTRMESCGVLNDAPYNVVGSFALGFGQTSICGMGALNLGSQVVGPGEGFEACDGALLEIEAVLFITDRDDMSFDPSAGSVYGDLNPSEFISIDLGTIEININNEFPSNGQPLTTAEINEFATGAEGPLIVNCGEDVELYVEGLSRLANCLEYDDIFTGIPSELSNELYYTINGGAPIFIQNAASGAAGGVLTGPDPALGGNCYAGILGPYTLEWNSLPPDLCDGSNIVVTITTTDVFSGVTLSDDITINYTGAACTSCGIPGCTDMTACNYNPEATEDDGSCQPAPTCNTDPCAGDLEIVDPADACVCIVDQPQMLGCTDATACNYNAAANCDDASCMPVPTCNLDPCVGDIEMIDPNDACACIVDVPQVLGCTDATACNYDATANCDDGSCDFGNAACADPCNPVMGCIDATACNYDPNACVDDGSCTFAPCNPGCTDACADNYDPTADEDDGSCNPYDDTCNADCTAGPFGGTWDTATCACINETMPVNGCTDPTAGNYDPAANCDDGSCIAACLAEAASIAGGPFQFCVGDGTPDFVSGITVSGGTGANTAWVITDDALNILGLPGMPGEVDFDGAGFGNCLIWYVTFENITGAEVGMNAGDLTGCFALSNSIEVVREDCGPCEEEITGAIVVPDEGCDVSGITISVIAPDGTIINVVTEADGTFSIPGGPFPCGNYIAAFFDMTEVPVCYAETGSTEPITFVLDGNEGSNNDFEFVANPSIPTLSQWGLIVMALLLMSVGAVQLFTSSKRYQFNEYKVDSL